MASEIRFAELRQLLENNGWNLIRIRGSHHIFTRPNAPGFAIPVHRNKVKDVYRKEVEKTIEDLEERGAE